MNEAKANFQKEREYNLLFLSLPAPDAALLMKIWTILLGRSFHVTPFLRISFISLRGVLRKRLAEERQPEVRSFPDEHRSVD